jgi:hypothetical protein
VKAGDVGGFTALTDVNDRDRSDTDRIPSGAFDQSIKRWQDSGERIPLYWEEIWSARHPIGSVDPATLRDVGGFGPFFDASIDLEGEHRAKAHDAWTAIKSNAVEVELDYLLLDNDEADGVRTLQEVDITGLTLKATPEGRTAIREERTTRDRDLKRECQEIQLQTLLGHDLYADLQARKAEPPEPESTAPTNAELRAKAAEVGVTLPPTYLDAVRADAKAHMLACLRGDDREAS